MEEETRFLPEAPYVVCSTLFIHHFDAMIFPHVFGIILIAILATFFLPIGTHISTTLGAFYTPVPTVLGEGQGPFYIKDTVHCEDVHHYHPANLLFTACEDSKDTRLGWFPAVGHLKPQMPARGSIHVVDPKTMQSTRLAFEGFYGSFVTHGIDVIEDPSQKDAVYIFAVNHLPNPEYFEAANPSEEIPKARSQIELFHHILQSETVQHVRSILNPLITTPNDIYAVSPTSFYVTNDHFYREGAMRLVEDVYPSAKWSSITHVQLTDLKSTDSTAGLEASVALDGLWNNNGLGHGRTEQEVVISSAIGGQLYISQWHETNNTISVQTTLAFDCVADNPSYYSDPYRTTEDDASGFVVTGITRAFYIGLGEKYRTHLNSIKVWYARLNGQGNWEKKVLFEDDGERIQTASTVVLVPIESVDGQKLAWCFVTGFMSESMIAVKVEL
ncbi:hypothetical protein N7495_009794 [Penicillium taxi]|uniref:uncharacterized protein n=1 Tax=Penicillium taxi TaxID=168475 RepID=UPI00254569D7|nr:uncharacterized protein N7495_009794 [Penicillium taxi]KAJ5885284.1 hypothetical protein N7495_009794 [Penicillium taxi]